MEIIITGAGIAGFSAGIALRRAGHVVTILEQSSLLHEVGAAISIAPNASPILREWGFSIEKAQMVAIKRASIQDGTTGQVLVPEYHKNVEQYGAPVYADPEQSEVTLADGTTCKADLVIAADGVHSEAKSFVLDNDEVITSNTGWASMRWLLPTEDLTSDPATAGLVEESTQRYFIGHEGGGLVWYMCRNNKVQNFLYMSKSFAPAANTEDFHSGIDPGMALEYGKKDFRPELQTVLAKAKDGYSDIDLIVNSEREVGRLTEPLSASVLRYSLRSLKQTLIIDESSPSAQDLEQTIRFGYRADMTLKPIHDQPAVEEITVQNTSAPASASTNTDFQFPDSLSTIAVYSSNPYDPYLIDGNDCSHFDLDNLLLPSAQNLEMQNIRYAAAEG